MGSHLRINKVTLMLAQFAKATTNGMLDVMGGGWTQVGPQPSPYFLAGLVELPWDAAGIEHTARFDLLDDQGKPVTNEGPDGEQAPVYAEGQFHVAPAPGTRRGTPLTVPFAIPIGAMQLPPGRFEWRLEVDGEAHEDWRLGFTVLPLSQSKAA